MTESSRSRSSDLHGQWSEDAIASEQGALRQLVTGHWRLIARGARPGVNGPAEEEE